MLKKDLKRIVKTYYDALEEGKLLGRKCIECGHVEFPPYLACNECGCLDTEWYEISGKAVATRIMPPAPMFVMPDFKNIVGQYCIASITLEEGTELRTSLVGLAPERADELRDKLPLPVHPVIIQEDGFKTALWALDE